MIAWMLENGPISKDQVIRHKCDTRCCVRLEHLEIGSYADNTADMIKRRRNLTGERCSWAKLSDADVVAIRSEPSYWGVATRMAERYQISVSLASLIRRDPEFRCA